MRAELAQRSKSGKGAIPQAQTRGSAPSPGFLRSACASLGIRPLPASGERWSKRITRRSEPTTSIPYGLPQTGEAGFTLVEVIAAFAILAFAFSILLAVISDGIWRSAQAEVEAEAGSLAASLLARAGTDVLTTGERTGRYDDTLRWRLSTEPYGDAGDETQGPIGAYRVTVEVFWHNGLRERSLVLSTLRLGPREPAR